MIRGWPKGKVFPLPIRELFHCSPAPLNGVKRVFSPDSEAACFQVGERHDADGPIPVEGGQNRNTGANDGVKVCERWLKASARDHIEVIANCLSEREDEILPELKRYIII